MADTFVTRLAQEIGMKLSSTTALDLLLGHFFQACCYYHVLPDNHIEGIQDVLGVLENAAMVYIKRNLERFQSFSLMESIFWRKEMKDSLRSVTAMTISMNVVS